MLSDVSCCYAKVFHSWHGACNAIGDGSNSAAQPARRALFDSKALTAADMAARVSQWDVGEGMRMRFICICE